MCNFPHQWRVCRHHEGGQFLHTDVRPSLCPNRSTAKNLRESTALSPRERLLGATQNNLEQRRATHGELASGFPEIVMRINDSPQRERPKLATVLTDARWHTFPALHSKTPPIGIMKDIISRIGVTCPCCLHLVLSWVVWYRGEIPLFSFSGKRAIKTYQDQNLHAPPRWAWPDAYTATFIAWLGTWMLFMIY